MKKILSLITLCFLAFTLSGCSENVDVVQPHIKTEKGDLPMNNVPIKNDNEEQKTTDVETVNKKEENKNFEILTLFSSPSNSINKLWVGTFQLVFNDMKNEVLKQKEVKFVGLEETEDLKGLNAEEFNKTMLQESSYFTSYGKTSPAAKEEIKKGIKEKFDETSDIVDNFDWSEAIGKYYAYAMLKKVFTFNPVFDELDKFPFNNSEKLYKYFGINNESKAALDNNVKVLFYNDYKNYAVQLLTKEQDIVYLYRTESDEDFKTIFNALKEEENNFKGKKAFDDKDTLKVPMLKIKGERNYKELCDKPIANTDPSIEFSDAIETIELELNEKGGKVKSEAMIMTRLTSMAPIEKELPRHFNFDKTFVLFLIDKDKKDPYLALRVKDLEGLTP